jgi:hypothetical protein
VRGEGGSGKRFHKAMMLILAGVKRRFPLIEVICFLLPPSQPPSRRCECDETRPTSMPTAASYAASSAGLTCRAAMLSCTLLAVRPLLASPPADGKAEEEEEEEEEEEAPAAADDDDDDDDGNETDEEGMSFAGEKIPLPLRSKPPTPES